MPTVRLLEATNMSALPATLGPQTLGWHSSYDIGASGRDPNSFSMSAIYAYGELHHIEGTATITEVLVDDADDFSAPNLLIEGLSFAADIDTFTDTNMNLFNLVSAMMSGNDVVWGSRYDDVLLGFAGADTLIGGAGADGLRGGDGIDTASYVTARAGVLANLVVPAYNSGDAAGDTYISIENITGSNYNDVLYGDGGVNVLKGGAGNDLLCGHGGADRLDGGAGIDTVTYDASGGVRADLLSPKTNTGHAAGDTYVSIENLDGSSFNDTLLGDNAANVIQGNTYHQSMSGRDSLYGRGGNDFLLGWDDNDLLVGGAGRDTMTGGTGADRFDFNAVSETGNTSASRDIITDFVHGTDKIDLSTIDASSKLAGNNKFVFRGEGALTTSKAGEVDFKLIDSKGTANDYTLVYGDTDADKSSEFQIKLMGLVHLTASDFVL